MKRTRFFLIITMSLIFDIKYFAFSQFVYNNGAEICIRPGAVMKVSGDISNSNSGKFDNRGLLLVDDDFTNNSHTYGDGDYYISGNWINNGLFTCGLSDVVLNGNIQNIGGNNSTYFYNLELSGTGTKNLQINTYVNNDLNLNDKELSTNDFTMFIENTFTNAIQRTSGFVSSLQSGGLSRKTSANAVYLFPVGSSTGTLRYRPVEIVPLDTSTTKYHVRMANINATNEGYDCSALGPDLCSANPYFYHLIDRISGTANADIIIYYDTIADGNWEGIANWKNNPTNKWIKIFPVQQVVSSPLSSLSFYNWNDFSNKPYILTKNLINVTINPVSPICENNKPIFLSASIGGGLWNGNGIIYPNSGIFDPQAAGPGTHQVIYTLLVPCGNSNTIDIIVNPVPSLSASVTDESCIGANDGTITLNVSGGTPAYTYSWNAGQNNSNYLNNLMPGIYYVKVTDASGCKSMDGFEVFASNEICYTPHAFVPNIFSPNGDGQNDVLYVKGKGILYITFIIYDRWGEKVFETTDISKGWDGQYKGHILNNGSFVYYLKALLNNNKIIENKGTITLVR